MAHAYVAFGLAHQEVYRLMFIQNWAYADVAFADLEVSGEKALSLLTRALALSGSPAKAETVWAALHGLVLLSVSATKYLPTPADALIDGLLDLCYPGVKEKPARRPSASRTA